MYPRIALFIIAAICSLSSLAFDFQNETLRYKVEYKWGLINKTAGSVAIKLRVTNKQYSSTLTAASAGWADKFYKVRDTLTCDIARDGFRPLRYVKSSHEGGDDKWDVVAYSYSGGTVTGDCVRKKWDKGKLVRDETRVLTSEGTTLDMLSSFYYMRNLPYQNWSPGHSDISTIFSGKAKEKLTIKYVGREKVSVDKVTYECYHIKFVFTSSGGKKSSDDIEGWIDCSTRIPIKLEGSLPIGKVRCFYVPN